MAKSSGIQSAHLEVFAAEFIGAAVLVLVGLSLVILNVWLWQPDRARRAERGVAEIDYGILLWRYWSPDRPFAGG